MIGPALLARSDQLASELVAPPHEADDVCPTCRSWRNTDGPLCDNCSQARDDLDFWCDQVIPISLYRKPSPLRDWLTHYKPGDEPPIAEYRANVGAILARYLHEHSAALQEFVGGYDAVCVVPSTDRPPPHELAAVYDDYSPPGEPSLLDALERGPGRLSHRTYSDDAYIVTQSVGERRILVLDDVYTTGARSQSATAALTAAGAVVPAILVIARRLNPDWDPHVQAIWGRQVALPFDFTAPPFWHPDGQGLT